jgi:hypothetical protein|tara:strand:+ start:294 stop:476 length:183 start_codon:yes stop_codon:yes gene_type:complete
MAKPAVVPCKETSVPKSAAIRNEVAKNAARKQVEKWIIFLKLSTEMNTKVYIRAIKKPVE